MSKALEYAVTPCNFIASNPMRLTRFSSKGMERKHQETHIVAAEQFEIILKNQTTENSRLLFILARTLGLRAGEACGLTWDKVDFEKGIITIDRQLLGLTEDSLYMENPKTEKSIRKIPFGDKLAQILLAEKQKQEKDQAFYGEYYCRYSINKEGFWERSDSSKDIPFVCSRRENGKPFRISSVNPRLFNCRDESVE